MSKWDIWEEAVEVALDWTRGLGCEARLERGLPEGTMTVVDGRWYYGASTFLEQYISYDDIWKEAERRERL